MANSAKVIADSVSLYGNRITTLEVTFPRFLLAEFNTHRMFSRCSASSRAVSVARMMRSVEEDPYVPRQWTSSASGMVGGLPLTGQQADDAVVAWDMARRQALRAATELEACGVHKQHINRLLEPFAWHTVIVTATEWSNFFHQRIHPNASPDMQEVARAILQAMRGSRVEVLEPGDWHLPLVGESNKDLPLSDQVRLSAARCARVSYLRHTLTNRSVSEDLALAERLITEGHLSPLEHQATPRIGRYGNLIGWQSYRNTLPYEHDYLGPMEGPTSLEPRRHALCEGS